MHPYTLHLAFYQIFVFGSVFGLIGQHMPDYFGHYSCNGKKLTFAFILPILADRFSYFFFRRSSYRMAVVADSTMALRNHTEPVFVMPPPFVTSALFRCDGTKPAYDAIFSALANLLWSATSASIVTAVMCPMPGIWS